MFDLKSMGVRSAIFFQHRLLLSVLAKFSDNKTFQALQNVRCLQEHGAHSLGGCNKVILESAFDQRIKLRPKGACLVGEFELLFEHALDNLLR
jgi:hypothetical protein